ncbi:MAG: adenylyl-sulfate kinase [Deltaproteobacteria bacterium]|nr:adenylyl-sulfate kinase [Deltaproteobacteria bacterium]
MVIWVTGLSGAGKTTLCRALYDRLKTHIPQLVWLDGDVVRKAFGNDLGYSEEERQTQLKRLQNLAKVLSHQGLVVLVAVLYSHPDFLKWNRQNFPEYFEIYLSVALDVLRQRDEKGLYNGSVRNVVGLDIPWHPPQTPALKINVDYKIPPERLALDVISAIPKLAECLEMPRRKRI